MLRKSFIASLLVAIATGSMSQAIASASPLKTKPKPHTGQNVVVTMNCVAPKGQKVYSGNIIVYVSGNGCVSVGNQATAIAKGNATVVAHGNAAVYATGNAVVIVYNVSVSCLVGPRVQIVNATGWSDDVGLGNCGRKK